MTVDAEARGQAKLSVGIIGAGIAGLAAAIALKRVGWDVEVFEKSKFKDETGAGITIGCNGNRILRRWGADFEAWRATENLQRVGRSHHEQTAVRINLDCEVVAINTDECTLRIADGTEIHKDLLIIADGIHTKFQDVIVGRPCPVIQTNKSVYRCLVPIRACLEDPLTTPLFNGQPTGLLGPNIRSHEVLCGSYPIRQNTILSVAYIHPTKPSEHDKVDWNCLATLDDIEESLSGFHPAIREIPRKVANSQGHADITCYKLVVRREIETFVKGRALLIGDAAHAMPTTHAQGAGMAIETAAAMKVFLKNLTDARDVPERLKLLNQLRHGRCIATQVMSNGMHMALQDPAQVARIRQHYQGELPAEDTKPWAEGFRDWFFAYDVVREAEDFLKGKETTTTDSRVGKMIERPSG